MRGHSTQEAEQRGPGDADRKSSDGRFCEDLLVSGSREPPQGTHTFRFCEPPPLERQEKALFAFEAQKLVASPASTPETTALSQLKKHIFCPVDSKGEHTCGKPVLHSPGTAQQSLSVVHVWVQYPPGTRSRQRTVPRSAPASVPASRSTFG